MSTDGELVFVGHGIVAPEYGWNDYEGVNVKGKIVLVMVNDPPATAESPISSRGRALTYYGRWTYKFEEAARQGAAGAILIHTDESATYPWQVVQTSWSGTQYSLPASRAARAPAEGVGHQRRGPEIVKRGGKDLEALRRRRRMRAPSRCRSAFAPATLLQTVARRRRRT